MRLIESNTHPELGPKQRVGSLQDALQAVRAQHPRASMEGSTGACRSFWVDGQLVGFAWEHARLRELFWVRIAATSLGKSLAMAQNGSTKPTAQALRDAREAAGLSQAQAAALLYRSLRNWQQWELGERRIDPALWELFMLKTGQLAKASH